MWSLVQTIMVSIATPLLVIMVNYLCMLKLIIGAIYQIVANYLGVLRLILEIVEIMYRNVDSLLAFLATSDGGFCCMMCIPASHSPSIDAKDRLPYWSTLG